MHAVNHAQLGLSQIQEDSLRACVLVMTVGAVRLASLLRL